MTSLASILSLLTLVVLLCLIGHIGVSCVLWLHCCRLAGGDMLGSTGARARRYRGAQRRASSPARRGATHSRGTQGRLRLLRRNEVCRPAAASLPSLHSLLSAIHRPSRSHSLVFLSLFSTACRKEALITFTFRISRNSYTHLLGFSIGRLLFLSGIKS